jgi:hypothetical protein
MDNRTVFWAQAEEKEKTKSEMTAKMNNRRIKTSFQKK